MQVNMLIQMLDEVKKIVIRNHAESFQQGKEFNIFFIQQIASDEVRICRFIRELLDPRGSHGQGSIFLRRFMVDVLKTDEIFSNEVYRNAHVIQEEVTSHGRRIDLVIHMDDHRIFPVEVKIYASDQIDQCYDYYKYAVSVDSKAKIFYLTLDGHAPSVESRRSLEPGKYECILFSEEILAWLDNCLNAPELERVYSVREIIIQFRDVIRKLTGREKGKKMNEIKEVIQSSYDNVMAAAEIIKAMPDVKIDKMREVFEGIKSHMTDLMFTGSEDNYIPRSEKYYRSEKYTWPSINYILSVPDKTLEKKIALRFEIGENLYMGIVPWWIEDNNSGEGKTQTGEDYVKTYLKPEGTILETKNEYWYWKKDVNEKCSVQFLRCNDEYYKLYDKKGFEDYMNGVYESIDSVLRCINLIK